MSDFIIETRHKPTKHHNVLQVWSLVAFFVATLALPILTQPNDATTQPPHIIWRGNSASLDAIQ